MITRLSLNSAKYINCIGNLGIPQNTQGLGDEEQRKGSPEDYFAG